MGRSSCIEGSVLLNIAYKFIMAASWELLFVIIVFGMFYVNLTCTLKQRIKKRTKKRRPLDLR